MLARYQKLASKEGPLFDFFTDELKAVLLAAALPLRAWRTGGLGVNARIWDAGDPRFLALGIGGVAVVASAISLTNFVRRPELSGRETTVDAFYQTVATVHPTSLQARVGTLVGMFLRWLNHYPSHLWILAIAGLLD